MPDIAAFYTGNLKTEKMPVYGPNRDLPCHIVQAVRRACIDPAAAARSLDTGDP
jgi:hypothetical protein